MMIALIYGYSCTTHDGANITDQLTDMSGMDTAVTMIRKADTLTDSDLIRKWTWNDPPMNVPEKSSISNENFSKDLLFRTWTWSDRHLNEAVLTFTIDSLEIHNEAKYVYSINFDSLRVFTSYDKPGDSYSRGMIKKLTEDTLVIKWSTDDVNGYVPLKKVDDH